MHGDGLGRLHPGKVFLTIDEIKNGISSYQIFDVRYDLRNKEYGINQYNKGHVARATFVDLDRHLSGPVVECSKARHPMPDPHEFVEWCKSKGIGHFKPVLCYDDECGAMGACRMWWMLNALGVEAYVMTCGFKAYEAAGLPVESTPYDKNQSTSYWPYATEFKRLLKIKDIPPCAHMVDTRPALRFNTTVRPYGPDDIPGHIEGAVNLPYDVNILLVNRHEKRLRPNDECRSNTLKLLQGMWGGGEPNISHCVFYCGSGVTAAFSIAVAYHVGLGEPYLYAGSWSEYADTFNFTLARRIIKEHGLLISMVSSSLPYNMKATLNNVTLVVDGVVVNNPDEELKQALVHLHIGEKAHVTFKSQRQAVIEAHPRIDT
ncbi:mercaptopyruvate sulfurtransferase, putative [Trypanosoma equiperdum]|uniref:Mercaptopyruvate sulfurtransferase, putative n=2 Tax=Trypanozoon TaxID=39700 RepID=Q582K7_TRYB2|nr:mercaptopyruvate sulfurtransferase, putative [Trypanosoma brucei brucei TREU927]AAX78825.1 mercaptopyruvate sulfurtransferase, putative [Trypanosoma brucei]AAZ12656.1 mercaptopyruvate sulfurtransferase, putative [Trypanosoma brucei brucei TREU927]SCU67183.1 mercaptopyruvate sulfurtransferase, putative [Trypanosoma equiperdum]